MGIVPVSVAKLQRDVDALDIEHALHVLDRAHDLVEMLYIKNLDGDFDAAFLIGTDRGAGIANAGLHVRDGASDAGDHAGPVFRGRQKLDRIGRLFRLRGPLDRHDALGIDHQLLDVPANRRVHCHPFAAGYVADDLFAVQRVTATRTIDHQVFNSPHDDGVIARDQTLDGAHTRAQAGFLLLVQRLKLLGTKIFSDYVSRYDLAVAHRRQQVFGAAISVFVGD